MKIPWTNIYKEHSQIIIKGVYLLVVPNQSVFHDEAKEKRTAMAVKQKQLALIEAAKIQQESSGVYN